MTLEEEIATLRGLNKPLPWPEPAVQTNAADGEHRSGRPAVDPLPGTSTLLSPTAVDLLRAKPGSDPSDNESQPCLRKYAFKYLARAEKLVDPILQKAFAFGNRYTNMAEAWQLHGTAPDQTTDEGRLLVQAIRFVPAPGLVRTETLRRVAFDGVTLFGFDDWNYRAGRLFGDWKTFNGNRRYILNTKTLPLGTQFLVYSESFLEEWPETDEITGRWVYGDKKTLKAGRPTAHAVEAIARREPRRLAVLQPALDTARDLRDRYQGDPNAIVNNPSACGGVGRLCDYRLVCRMYNGVQTMNDPLQDLMASLGKGTPAAAPVVPPAAAAPALPIAIPGLAVVPPPAAPPPPAPAPPPSLLPLPPPAAQVAQGVGGSPEAALQALPVAGEVAGLPPVAPAAPPVVTAVNNAPEAPAKSGRGKKTSTAPQAQDPGLTSTPFDVTELLRDGYRIEVTYRAVKA